MESYFTGMAAALWLGILTSISPCPLATNIAAISFIGKRVGNIRAVLLSGIVYSIGRMTAYVGVGIVVVAGLLSIPSVSMFLQRYMILAVGPILVIAGMFLLELLSFGFSGFAPGESIRSHAERGGVWGAGLLGIVFALSFCPVSAALFFGSLIPLAVGSGSTVLLPLIYGIGTGLPVMAFAVAIAVSAKSVGVVFKRLSVFELWARRITGIIFIGVGIFLSLRYIFAVL